MLTLSTSNARANEKYASIVMDAGTGKILSQSNADKVLHPASLTKMMTLSVLFDEIESGRIKTYNKIKISEYAASMSPSKLGIPVGGKIRVKDAIYSLVTKSANDIAVAVGEHISGSEREFAKRMTKKARDIGMTRTRFVNASGLHNKKQISTARDMAILARYMLHSQAKYYHYFKMKKFTYNGKTYKNHNKLLSSYGGMDGFKTGYVRASGFNLVASAKRNDRRIIGVVYGGKTSKRRNDHMAVLLDRGFNKIQRMPLMVKNIPVPPRKPGQEGDLLQEELYATTMPSAGISDERFRRILENSNIEEIIGQGDIDPDMAQTISERIGSAQIHKEIQKLKMGVKPKENWSIQVGAYFKKSQTNTALQSAMNALPLDYRGGNPLIVPMETRKNGLLYRARISGYSKSDAKKACSYLKDCVPVSPNSR